MLIGLDFKARQKQRELKAAKKYEQMVPRPKFAWYPIKLDNRQHAWLQTVWCYASFRCNRTTLVYCITEQEAKVESARDNIYSRLDEPLLWEASQRL